jgi:hypothetical protein
MLRGVERSRGLGDPNVPLSVLTGVQLVPRSPKRVEGDFSEVRELRILVSRRAEFSRELRPAGR